MTSVTPRLEAQRRLMLLIVFVGVGCSPQPTGPVSSRTDAALPEREARPPVVLVSIDTLRSDRLPMYGYDRISTPALDALRADAILVERAYAHLPLTLPSHTSIFTGRLPVEHEVRDNLGYKVSDRWPTMAGLLAAEGYATGAAVSAYVLRRATGISRGFDHYDDAIQTRRGVELGALQRSGEATLAAALEWLDRAWAKGASSRPPFLFLHLYEPHSPYQPPQPWASRVADPYDGEIAAADAVIAQLTAALRSRELYDDALIVLLSDHGEGLMDHGEMEHEVLIYRETIQVPLLVKLPDNKRGGDLLSVPAQLIDVLPTVLDVIGIGDIRDLPGKSLLELREEDRNRPILSESVYPKIHFGWSDLASIVQDRFHFIEGPEPELFDLSIDPDERHNLLRSQRSVSRRLRAELERVDRRLKAPSEVDPAVRERLLSLGYVGGSSVGMGDSRIDPKSQIHVLEALGDASRLYSGGEHERAVVAYRRVLEDQPGMIYAREQLAKALRRSGKVDESLAEIKVALEASGGAPHIALAAAELYLHVGELGLASEHAHLAKSQNEAAWDLLAQIALRQDNLEETAAYIDKARSLRGTRLEPLITLTELRVRQKRFEEALVVAADVQREFGERTDVDVLRGLAHQRGVALANLGRTAEAEAAFREEIALSPKEVAPYSHLALLLALDQRGEEAVASLREMTEVVDTPLAYREAAQTLRTLGNAPAADGLLQSARRRWPGTAALREPY